MTNDGIKSVGEIVGPFGLDVTWAAESSDEDRAAAQPFIVDLMKNINESGHEVPDAITVLAIRRV